MAFPLILISALWMFADSAAGQTQPPAPRSTTERPNMSAAGLEQTLSGVLMDAGCSAIADGRSDLTQTPKITPPRDDVRSPLRATEREAAERSRTQAASESDVPEMYRDCKLKSSTTSFAAYANGKLYVLDRISNQMMQEHMLKARSDASDKNSTGWLRKTLVGTTTSGDVLTLRSIRK